MMRFLLSLTLTLLAVTLVFADVKIKVDETEDSGLHKLLTDLARQIQELLGAVEGGGDPGASTDVIASLIGK